MHGKSAPEGSPLLSACAFASGAAALLYEVVWGRQLGLFLGITTYAHTAVLTAYMGGLAVGSLVVGRWADRVRGARLYAWLELGIGGYALLTLWLVPALQRAYALAAPEAAESAASTHALRFAIAAASLLTPTFLMGGTTPVLVRAVTRRVASTGRTTGAMYGLNTLGGAVGACAAGFLLIPRLGVSATLCVGVAINLVVALCVLALLGGREREEVGDDDRRPLPRARHSAVPELAPAAPALVRLALVGYGVSGFVALLYQVAWLKALTLVIGSSVYAFSATLTVFLLGLALGSLLWMRWLRVPLEPARALRWAGVLEIGAGFTGLLSLTVISRSAELFFAGYRSGRTDSFAGVEALSFELTLLVALPTTLLLGVLLPLMAGLSTRRAGAVGRSVGGVFGVNTAGTVAGALVGGLVMLPQLGIQRSIMVGAGLHVVVGALFVLVPQTGKRPLRGTAVAVGAFLLLAASVPSWDRQMMISGPFVNAARPEQLGGARGWDAWARLRDVIFYREGLDGVVAVTEADGQRFLVINGKTDASTTADRATQVLLGELPMLLHPSPGRVLVVGLGSGITADSVARHDTLERMDVIEISHAVVAASRLFEPGGGVLDDPRVHLAVADARSFLLTTRRSWDVVVSEPSNPWISGVSNLFTREFLLAARSRLAPGGLMVQWFHAYSMDPEDLRVFLATFRDVFPEVTVWHPLAGDLILIGQQTPPSWDYRTVATRLAVPAVAAQMAGIGRPRVEQLALDFFLDSSEVERMTEGVPLNTDDRPRLEFSAPKQLLRPTIDTNLRRLLAAGDQTPATVPLERWIERQGDALESPSLGVRVEVGQRGSVEAFSAQWLARWVEVPNAPQLQRYKGSALRLVDWREGGFGYRLVSQWLPAAPPRPAQEAMGRSNMPGTVTAGGELGLADGVPAFWYRSETAGSEAAVTVGLQWTCPVAGGVNGEFATVIGPEQAGPEIAAAGFASRFRCLEAAGSAEAGDAAGAGAGVP